MKYVSPVVAATSNLGGSKCSSNKCLYKIQVGSNKSLQESNSSRRFRLCCFWKCGYDAGDSISGKDVKGIGICITTNQNPCSCG